MPHKMYSVCLTKCTFSPQLHIEGQKSSHMGGVLTQKIPVATPKSVNWDWVFFGIFLGFFGFFKFPNWDWVFLGFLGLGFFGFFWDFLGFLGFFWVF